VLELGAAVWLEGGMAYATTQDMIPSMSSWRLEAGGWRSGSVVVFSSAEAVYTRFCGEYRGRIGKAFQPAASRFRLYSSLIYHCVNSP
jgi:hypothetical protein